MAVLNVEPRATPSPASERRLSWRRPLAGIPAITDVRLQSKPVGVVNVSAGGLLIDVSLRLLPGVQSLLEIVHIDGVLRVSGRVVRSEIVNISGRAVQYRSAIAFDRRLDFIDQDVSSELVPSGQSADVIAGSSAAATELEQHFALNGW